jgi:hypothetical protein
MILRSILIISALFLWAGSLLAQKVPGYMGKRFVIQPKAMGGIVNDWFHAGGADGINFTWSKYLGAQLEYVTTLKTSVGFEFNREVASVAFEYDLPRQQSQMAANSYLAYISYYTHDFISPIGSSYSLGLGVMTYELLGAVARGRTDSIVVNMSNGFVNRTAIAYDAHVGKAYNASVARISWTNRRLLFGTVFWQKGVDLSLVFGGNALKTENDNYTAANVIPRKMGARIRANRYFSFELGIGIFL